MTAAIKGTKKGAKVTGQAGKGVRAGPEKR